MDGVIGYLNTDLDLISGADLTLLAAAFKAPSHAPDYPLFQSVVVQWIGVAIAILCFKSAAKSD